ncbi:hypothetical protein R1sor_019709 [Riccia sorocarpa]|uniref:Uncharacterized protein n=1 Tax=Riccia sorocarpa TaxID=122646 RepID=A0ABD3IDE9_9MARC
MSDVAGADLALTWQIRIRAIMPSEVMTWTDLRHVAEVELTWRFNEWGTPPAKKEEESEKKKRRVVEYNTSTSEETSDSESVPPVKVVPSAEYVVGSTSGGKNPLVTPQSSVSSPPVERELGKFLLDLKRGSTCLLTLLQPSGEVQKMETEDEVAIALKKTFTTPSSSDLTPWRNVISKLLRELSLERQHTRHLEEQRVELEAEVARAKKIPEMTSWVADQLKLARDTEQKLTARNTALEAALHAKEGQLTDTEEEKALQHIHTKLAVAHSSLEALLGVTSSSKAGESRGTSSSVSSVVEEARALLATHQ